MNPPSSDTVSLHILGKQYPIKCSPERVPALRASAALLNQKINEVKQRGRLLNSDHHVGLITVAALNLAYELIEKEDENESILKHWEHSMRKLMQKVDHALEETD